MENIKRLDFCKVLHEIKNPLTVVSGYLELMEDGSNNEKFYKIIDEEIKRTLSIIREYSNNIEIEFEEIELDYLIEDIVSNLKDLYKNNNVYFSLEGDSEIYFDSNYDKLKQIFLNIIKNAYEAKKDSLLIKIKWNQDKDNTYINIIDNGIGISLEDLNRIGEDFYTTKENGTGLGIPFIIENVKKLGGDVKYNSIKGRGTEVKLTFKNRKNSEEF